MNDEVDKNHSETGADLDPEIRKGRKFTPQEALARLAGPGAMKGASPVSPVIQAETEIGNWLRSHVSDPVGALHFVLQRNLKGSELLLENLAQPLTGLVDYCRSVLASDFLLDELVRETDVEWGQRMDERPHFEREGIPLNPGDPYTAESVRLTLSEVVDQLTT